MTTTSLTLSEIYNLAHKTMLANGCDEANAEALADIIYRAERDGCSTGRRGGDTTRASMLSR